MYAKKLSFKISFQKIVTVSKFLEVPKFQKNVSMCPFGKCIFPKNACKKSFPLSAVWREKSSHVGKRSYADWIGFCAISASVTLCIDSAQQLDKGKRDPRTKNRKRQHLHCVSLETAALALRLVGFSVLHWKAKQPASKEKQKLWRVNMCTR